MHGRRVGVWGAGLEGQSVLRHLAGVADATIIIDGADEEQFAALRQRFGVDIVTPAEAIARDFDVIIRSPGVPIRRPEVAQLVRQGTSVIGLLALWLAEHSTADVIGVTGTKGKSTTAHLCTALLLKCGIEATLGGNIGIPVLDLPHGSGVYVVEVSSYQAADVRNSPAVGVLTNLDSDHLPWHGGIEGYWRDKMNLFEHDGLGCFVTDEDLLITHPAVRSSRARSKARPGDVTLTKTEIAVGGMPATPLSGLFTMHHNALNLALAVRAARAVCDGVDRAAIGEVMDEFRGLPSRLEEIAVADGVRFIDDALASNPLACRTGSQAMGAQPFVLIAGGADRQVEVASLARALCAMESLLGVVLMSQTGERWLSEFLDAGFPPDRLAIVRTDDVAEAVAEAGRFVQPGAALLFSPGAPTPSSMGTYVDRSAAFRRAAAVYGRSA